MDCVPSKELFGCRVDKISNAGRWEAAAHVFPSNSSPTDTTGIEETTNKFCSASPPCSTLSHK
jgi:hypothetical protein